MAEQAKKTAGDAILGYFRDFKVLGETRSEYWGVQLINFIDCTIYFAMIAISTVFLSEDIGFSDIHAGYVVTGFTVGTTICLFFSGMVTDWLGIRKSLYISMISLGIIRLLMVVMGLDEGIPYRGEIVAVLFFLMAPFMAMVQTVFQAANKRFTTKKSRSAGFSLWYMFMNLGGVVGGLLIDLVRVKLEISNSHIFSVGAVAALLSLGVIFLLIRREEQLLGPEEQAEADKQAAEDAAAGLGGTVVEKKPPMQVVKEVVAESAFWKLLVLIALLLGVRAVFTYMYLLMPKYWIRVIGEDVMMGTLQAINPFLIVVGIILFIPFANRYNIFKMLVYGSIVSAMSLFVFVLPWNIFSADVATAYYTMAIIALVVLSLGEVVWSPKLSEYTAAIAPAGQEGTYLGMSMVPWFLAKTIVSLLSGHMLLRWCPEGMGEQIRQGTVKFWDSPEAMFLILAIVAIAGPIMALLMRGWLTKGARWKQDEHGQVA